MENSQVYINVDSDMLISQTYKLHHNGYRLVQISATKKGKLDLLYTFDKNYKIINLRLEIEQDEEIQSIGDLYPYAFLYENEMKDLFGVKIVNMNIDFNGHLYKTSIKTPFITVGEQVK